MIWVEPPKMAKPSGRAVHGTCKYPFAYQIYLKLHELDAYTPPPPSPRGGGGTPLCSSYIAVLLAQEDAHVTEQWPTASIPRQEVGASIIIKVQTLPGKIYVTRHLQCSDIHVTRSSVPKMLVADEAPDAGYVKQKLRLPLVKPGRPSSAQSASDRLEL